MKNGFFYKINKDYIDYLKGYESNERNITFVPNTQYRQGHEKFFYGIALQVNGNDYYVPVSHKRNKEDHSFVILDNNGNFVATLQFRFMIPVPKSEVKYLTFEDIKEDAYREFVTQEWKYCARNYEIVMNQALHTYTQVNAGYNYGLVNNSCNFLLLEKACQEWTDNLMQFKSKSVQMDNKPTLSFAVIDDLAAALGNVNIVDGTSPNSSYYEPMNQTVVMPRKGVLDGEYAYCAVALHELVHASGIPMQRNARINNELGDESFRYEDYIVNKTTEHLLELFADNSSERRIYDSFHANSHRDVSATLTDSDQETIRKLNALVDYSTNYMIQVMNGNGVDLALPVRTETSSSINISHSSNKSEFRSHESRNSYSQFKGKSY